MSRPALALLLFLVALAMALFVRSLREAGQTPLGEVVVEALALDVIKAFERGDAVRVVHQDTERPLSCAPAVFEKDHPLASDESRKVILAHADSAFEARAGPFGPGARLVVRTLVYTAFHKDPTRADPAPVDFLVLVDGVERARLRSDYVLQPGAVHVFDQLMRTFSVSLDDVAGRPVTLRFETVREGPPAPDGVVPATPIWWDVSVRQPVRVPRQRAAAERPNLLVLCVDTLGARRMGMFGYGRATTPALSAFARRAVVFDAASSSSSWTLPATASLLTGLPPNTHGVLGDARSYLMEGLATWPERLREQGLEGAAFVANALVSEANNFHQGFGTWVQDNDADAAELNRQLLAWLDTQPAQGRWFAYLHYMDPHAPYAAPGPARDRFCDGYTEQRDFGGHLPTLLRSGEAPPLTEDERDHVVDLYDGEVAYFDERFAELLQGLEQRGLGQSTAILLVGDHGEELFEHDRLGHGFSLYEELLHVPLVLAAPGLAGGTRMPAPVSTASVASTLLRLAGLRPEPGAAPSLLPLSRAGPGSGPAFAMTRTHLFGPRRVLVSARDEMGRKVICRIDEASEPADGDRTVRAFSLRDDPGERAPLDLADLARPEREAYEALAAAALRWHEQSAARRPAEPQPENEAIQEALRQVGYLR